MGRARVGSCFVVVAVLLVSCGGDSSPTLQGDELRGDWVPPDDCEVATLAGGPLRLRFVGR